MNDIEYEKFVGKVLRNLGAERSYRGFDYITYGTALVVKDGRKLYYITKSLYPEIAIKYRTTWRCVERDIRTIVDTIWKNGDKEFLKMISGEEIKEKPNNSRFLELVAAYVVRLEKYGVLREMENCLGQGYRDFLDLKEKIEELEKENEQLKMMDQWLKKQIEDLAEKLQNSD
ncbi:sporulation initiation factor Spo0A C-terminal domain-containing protein [Lachnoclostridium edouardi]|uniref:sporulation initiation factor Spo0A C-terminal domain-containing protein n=1 Tax=Lachnoclostridium edouardi TaxID=1926283 RepID=UPI000C7CFD6A|nr:sporulation initiation factor Spo0A C-terminal domain-containing protein [Lachnoclostridium edouardi]